MVKRATTPTRRLVKRGEPLAIMAEALHSGAGAIWWDALIPEEPKNERHGNVMVVKVRGSLEHHKGYGCDSYDAIIERARHAFNGCVDDEDEDSAGPPECVVLRVDSPGGVVSGLNETVYALRKLSTESGIPLVAYVDELAASAAYALSCSCERIVLPASAIAGSVGVISCMYDQVAFDEDNGFNFVTLTSGARKADGHPHVPISDAAITAEQRRVDRLAKQFFRIVSGARGLPVDKIASYQAGIFLGGEAVAKGLADDVMGWDALLADLTGTAPAEKDLDKSTVNGSMSSNARPSGRQGVTSMITAALVKKTRAAAAKATDPKERKRLTALAATYQAALEAYKKEKHTVEKHETEESDEEDEESEESEESEEESEESEESEAKGNETDRKQSSDDDDGDGDDDDDSDDEDDEESAAAASTSSLQRLAETATGRRGRKAVGALAAKLAAGERALKMVEQISRERRAEKKTGMITAALNSRRITKHEAKTLHGKPLSFVSSFLDMRPKAIVNHDDDSLYIPAQGAGKAGAVTEDVMRSVEIAVASAPDGVDKDALRAKMIADHENRMHAGINGAGRY